MTQLHGATTAASTWPNTFGETIGLEDWQVSDDGARAYFRTGSFSAGSRFVRAIEEATGPADEYLAVDLWHDGVTVRLTTNSDGFYGLTPWQVESAGLISQVARAMGMAADPEFPETAQITLDTLGDTDIVPFWHALLGNEASVSAVGPTAQMYA